MSQFHSIENTLVYVAELTRLYEKHIEKCEEKEDSLPMSGDAVKIMRKLLDAQTYHRTKSFSKAKDSLKHEKVAYLASLAVREYNCLHTFGLSGSPAHLKIAKDILKVLQNAQTNTVLRER